MATLTLTQRVELERDGKQPSEVTELNLSGSKSGSIEGLSDEYSNLELLSLAGVGLEDISGLPKLPSLKILELTDNLISGGLDILTNCPNLEHLNLSGNKIASVEALVPLAKLSNLRNLDLVSCEVTEADNYRKAVFAALPNLKFLDGRDENNETDPADTVPNGDTDDANGEENEDEEESEDEEEEEEYGLEVLQRSGELEDDDEDYAPGEEEDADLSEYDEDEEEEDEEVDDGANLSGAGITGPRRAGGKRPRADGAEVDDETPAAKQKAGEDNDSQLSNGASVE